MSLNSDADGRNMNIIEKTKNGTRPSQFQEKRRLGAVDSVVAIYGEETVPKKLQRKDAKMQRRKGNAFSSLMAPKAHSLKGDK